MLLIFLSIRLIIIFSSSERLHNVDNSELRILTFAAEDHPLSNSDDTERLPPFAWQCFFYLSLFLPWKNFWLFLFAT